MRLMKHCIAAGLLASAATMGAGLPAASAEDTIQATAIFALGEIPLSQVQNAVLPQSILNDRHITLGGISDLWHDAGDPPTEFWAVIDRGPNGQVAMDGQKRRTFPVPEFTPSVLHLRLQAASGEERPLIRVLQIVPIVGRSGKGVGGLPNLPEVDPPAFDYTGTKQLDFNPSGLDTEGLVRMRDGSFWVAEEYGPSLVHIDSTGRVQKRFTSAGKRLSGADYEVSDVLPAIYAKRRDNRGFEALALSPDGRILYACMQSSLQNPTGKTGKNSRNCRILAFDTYAERPTAEYVYRFDVAAEFEPGAKADDMKIGAASMIGSDQMLVLERTDTASRIYAIDMATATNVLGTPWHAAEGPHTLESMDDPSQADIQVCPKQLVVDLTKRGEVPGKMEGMTVVGDRYIALANDNDFSFGDFDAEGNATSSNVRSQVVLLRLTEPLGGPKPRTNESAATADRGK